MMDDANIATVWYRQFWPWFLIALPAVVVIASLVTIYIASQAPDPIIQRSEDERIGPVIFEDHKSERE